MRLIIRRWQAAVGILMILLLASGCFTNVGDQANAPAISLQFTATEPPTEEPSPTAEPTQEPEETVVAQEVDEEVVDLPIAENPTETATATATATEGITEVAQLGDLGQALQTDAPEIDPFSLTATSIIATATAGVLMPTWAAETQTAQAILINPLATATTDFGLFPATATQGVQPLGSDCVHEVRTGDTLFRMSMNYGIAVMDIANRNGIANPNIISVGQMLIINGCGTTGVFPPATSMPTQTFGTGGPGLDGNPSGTGSGVGCASQYTVNQYDNLFQISLQYGVSVQSIANANGIANINIIDMGTVLCIPAQ